MADRSTTSFNVSQRAQTINLTVSNNVVPPDAKVDLTSVNNSLNSINEAQKKLSNDQAALKNKLNDINVPQDNRSQELADITAALKNLTVVLGGLVKNLGSNSKKTTSTLVDSETVAAGIMGAFTKKETQRGLAEALNRLDIKKREY